MTIEKFWSLIDQAYEAGKKDKELSLVFDNPKRRFMSHLRREVDRVNKK